MLDPEAAVLPGFSHDLKQGHVRSLQTMPDLARRERVPVRSTVHMEVTDVTQNAGGA